MSKQLYEEALADVKKLKEVAEDNAKRALLEAVTPRIKDLIENQLLGEVEKDIDGKLLLDDEPETESVDMEYPFGADSELPGSGEEQVALDLDALQMSEPEVEEVPGVQHLKVPGKEDVYELSVESARALGLLVNESGSQFDKKLKSIAQQLHGLSNASRIIKESAGFDGVVSSLLKEVEDMYAQVQEKMGSSKRKSTYESILEDYYSTLKQLTEQKMKRIKTLSEADVTLKLTGLPDEVDLDSVGVDLITGEGGGEEEGGEEEGGEEEELDLGDEEEEGGEEAGEEEEELDLGGDEEEEEGEETEEGQQHESRRRLSNDLVVEIDEGMLRREISKMRRLREAKDDVQAWGHGPGEVSDDFEDDDLGDPFLDIDLTTESQHQAKKQAYGQAAGMQNEEDGDLAPEADMDESYMNEDDMVELDMDEADMDEADMDQAKDEKEMGGNQDEQSNKQSRQPGATVESLRRQLAAEARLQSEAKQKAQKAQQKSKQSQKEAQQKHKAAQSQMKEAQKQASQGKKVQAKQNKQLAQKKHQESQQKKKQAKKMQEAYVFYARRFNESVRRTRQLKGMLNEAVRQGSTLNSAPTRSAGETTDLRNKLAETNLFNTKLMFANKVLQNESFTRAQKAGIIERLDEARSEREVKLVYESLVKTLNNAARRQVNESRERAVVGSSSRPTKPASTQTLNEGFETDRWARLAGIVK